MSRQLLGRLYPCSGIDHLGGSWVYRGSYSSWLVLLLVCRSWDLLCASMAFFTFGMQLYDIFNVLRLKSGLKIWASGKLLSTISRNIRPTLVFTLASNGGLNQVMFLDLFLLLLVVFRLISGLYFSW